jgi:hypothetical protein
MAACVALEHAQRARAHAAAIFTHRACAARAQIDELIAELNEVVQSTSG